MFLAFVSRMENYSAVTVSEKMSHLNCAQNEEVEHKLMEIKRLLVTQPVISANLFLKKLTGGSSSLGTKGLIISLFSNYKGLQKSLPLESPGAFFSLLLLNRKKNHIFNEMLV